MKMKKKLKKDKKNKVSKIKLLKMYLPIRKKTKCCWRKLFSNICYNEGYFQQNRTFHLINSDLVHKK